MYATTDELWFDEWEHGGPPWGKNRDSVRRSTRRTSMAGNLGKFKTPMLVIHNDLDFRCPVGQGHELFTACSARACRRGSSTSPTRATGC